MRLRLLSGLFAATVLCASSAAVASDKTAASNDIPEQTSPASPVVPARLPGDTVGIFSRPVAFRGTLGDLPIQVTIRPKEIAEEGLEGEYFYFGRSHKILLAGESEGKDIFLEESENGTNISGHWEGKLQDGLVLGTWTSADSSVSKPFSLRPIQSRTGPPKRGRAQKKAERTRPGRNHSLP